MRHVIVHLLLCSVLFSGVAWAANSDAEAFFGHASETMHDTQMHSQHDDSHPESNDHGCHGIAHLVGLMNTSNYDVHIDSGHDVQPVILRPRSTISSPPTHVPI